MQSNGAKPSRGSATDHSATRAVYVRPKATIVTPDEAEAAIKAKAALGIRDSDSCLELVAEARKRQNERPR